MWKKYKTDIILLCLAVVAFFSAVFWDEICNPMFWDLVFMAVATAFIGFMVWGFVEGIQENIADIVSDKVVEKIKKTRD